MAHGKYLSLEEARRGATKGATIDHFCKEHPSTGDADQFWRLMEAVTKPKGSEAAGETSGRDSSASYGGTRTRPGTSEDAS